MTQWYFFASGGLSILWLAVHLFAGGKDIVRPLRDGSELPPMVRDTLYICWHFTSLSLAIMAALFLWTGATGNAAAGGLATIMAAGFAMIGIGLAIRQGANHLEVPQGWLFVPVASLGCIGLLS